MITSVNLKQKLVSNSSWLLAVYVAQQGLRFASNLLLTYLLLPEHLGLMAIVNVILVGLVLFSDFGIAPSIIYSERGATQAFQNTAWTVQLLRALLLFIVCVLLSGPIASWYQEPQLQFLLPAAGIGIVIQGLRSTQFPIRQRNLELRDVVLSEFFGYVASVIVMIIGAWLYKSIWALILGGLVGKFVVTALSHLWLGQALFANRFQWDRSSFSEIFSIGRWIFLSTAFHFTATQLDRVLFGRLGSIEFLGVYHVALMLATLVEVGIGSIGQRVLFPTYAELQRETPQALDAFLAKSRLGLIACVWAVSLTFVVLGEELVTFLYAEAFKDAGWMLEILALASLFKAIGWSYDYVLIGTGKMKQMAILNGLKFVIFLTAILVGYAAWGVNGLVVSTLLSAILGLIPTTIILEKQKLFQPRIDAFALGLASAVLLAYLRFAI